MDVRGKFFTMRVMKCWNRLLREVVDAPPPWGCLKQVRWDPGQPDLVFSVEVGGPACGGRGEGGLELHDP